MISAEGDEIHHNDPFLGCWQLQEHDHSRRLVAEFHRQTAGARLEVSAMAQRNFAAHLFQLAQHRE